MTLNWEQLMRERTEWVERNFPNIEPLEPAMGVMEEVGELAHAHLKEKQQIRMNEDHVAKAKDAIGDIIVYLLGSMHYMGVLPADNYKPQLRTYLVSDPNKALLRLGWAAGNLCQMTIHGIQDRASGVNKVVYFCRRYCELRGWDFEEIVTTCWDEVKQRDWITNPDDADKKIGLDLVTGECACYAQGLDPRMVSVRCVHSKAHAEALTAIGTPLR